MAKRGIAQVTGPKSIKLGETARYWVSKIYRKEDDEKVPQARWKLYVKEDNGFRELRPVAGTPPKVGSETTITITNQQLLGKELLLEAYLYAPEISSPPGILIKVEEGAKKIERVDLFRADDTPIGRGETVKYGQSITAKVITLNMPYEEVEITLYEDDESGGGHHANNEKNKIASVTKRLDKDGFTMHTFNLPIDIKRIANTYMDGTEDRYHEYYIHVKSAQGARTSDNINVPNPDYIFPEQEIEAVEITVKAKGIGTDPMPDTGKSASIVNNPPEKEEKDSCVCKQYDLVWGNKVSCEFRKKVVEISKRQNFDPNHLMAVMKVESAGTFSPSKIELVTTGYRKNGKPIKEYKPLSKDEILKKDENFRGAVGLIQFTPVAIKELNTAYGYKLTKRKLALMSQLEQLDYVEKYIEFWKKANKIQNKLTLADLYLVVFAPGKMNGSDDNTTLYAKDTEYYNANASVDTDGKNGITKKEIAARAYISLADGMSQKENVFQCGDSKEDRSEGGNDSKWHDPIDYSQRTYYNSSGVHREQNGAFGPVRTKIVKGRAVPKNHQGLDIFADIKTVCKACLDGKIVSYMNEGSAGYGNVLVLEVSGEDLRNAKRDYKLEFTAEKESGAGFDINADKFYLRYAHLSSAIKTEGYVKAGEPICYSGDTGNAKGVPNPHLHFEIAMKKSGNGTGLNNRYNPAFFVRLKPINKTLQDEVKKKRS